MENISTVKDKQTLINNVAKALGIESHRMPLGAQRDVSEYEIFVEIGKLLENLKNGKAVNGIVGFGKSTDRIGGNLENIHEQTC